MTARILIVDDIESIRCVLEARLRAEYFEVACASDGTTAISMAREAEPDVVLLDVMMPGIDGFETCRRLKQDPRTLHVPVVMITTLGEPAQRVRGLEAGADDFLTKPADFPTLLARVRSLVRLKRLIDEWRRRGDTARALGLHGEQALPGVAGTRALVVDDSGADAVAVQGALLREGILPGLAASEAEMFALLAAIPFDLVVLSLGLAAADPLRIASRLRAGARTQELPLLLIAAPEQRDRILRGFDLGANDWLLRPLDENELRARARNQIRRKFYYDRLRADFDHGLHIALTDPLTGCYTVRYLMSHLATLLAGPAPRPVALLLIDIDALHAVNDRWGYGAGDTALRMVADALRAGLRVNDSIARHDGDAFAVVMPDAGELDAVSAAERLRGGIEQLRLLPEAGLSHRLTASVGVSWSDAARRRTPEGLVQSADQALRQAKRGGPNRVETVQPAAT
jgi:two-component system cell cycle response regulator